MKKFILSFSAFTITLFAYAQELEVDAALTALESKNLTLAKSEIAKVASQIDANTISPQTKAKYHYVSGQLSLQDGNSVEAAKEFGELAKYEGKTFYAIKNKSNKSIEYYQTMDAANSAAAKGDYTKAKEESIPVNYLGKVQDNLKGMAEKALQAGNTAYQAGNNEEAANKFLEASYLVKALGGDAQLFKYNAALTYHRGEKYDQAISLYKELISDGYTGASSSWVGKEKSSGKEVSFASKQDADMQAKLGLVTDIKEVKGESVEKELYENTLKALSSAKKYDEIVDKITSKYPNDTEIQTLAGNILHFSGNDDKFLDKLLENTKLDPKNPVNYFNIGVIYMNQNKDAEAIQYFEKAIEVDPTYKNAYTNIALVKVKPEKEYVEIINANLGNSANEKKTYQEYSQKRKQLYIEILPYLQKAFDLDKTNYEAAKALRQAYQAAENYDKEDEMRAIEKSLDKK